MRIAISGTHFSGKSTLVSALAKRFSNYSFFEEPYHLLEEQGVEFPHPPTIEDFEQMIDFSISLIKDSEENTLFDRCPIDYLAYALISAETHCLEETIYLDEWETKIEEAMELLDLIVFVPIEDPDRILVPKSQDLQLRRLVDEKIYELLIEDSLELSINAKVIEVEGSFESRVKMIESNMK